MSRFKLVVVVTIFLALVGASGLASAQEISPFFFGMSMTGGMVGLEPWPVDNFTSARLWDSGTVAWSEINTGPGVYDWRELNIWMNKAEQNGISLMYCFGRTPTWASSHPGDKSCGNELGSCDAPDDLKSDGTGPDQHWKDFVRAIAEHSAGRIHYWELWDEFPNPYRWNWLQKSRPNTVQQLTRMAADARAIIKAVDPTAVIVSDSGSLRYTEDVPKWQELASAGAFQYADILAFHGYTQPLGYTPPNPETLVALFDGASQLPWGTAGFVGFLQQYGLSGMTLWDTEASWAENLGALLVDADEQAGFATRFNLLHQSLGVQRFFWYEWDNTDVGTLWEPTTRYDLALPNANGNVSTMLGFGDGSFQSAVDHGAGSNPVAVAVGDFNNDGTSDIVVANQGSDNVSVLLNNDGTFEAGLSTDAGNSPVAVAAGDFNQDGNLDVVVANGGNSNTVTVLLGKGNGYFEAQAPITVGTSPVSVAVGDFNQDGYPDIVVANAGSNNITVLTNNGKSGGFTAATYAVGNGPSSVAVGNFVTKSKYPDLAVTNATDGTVSVLLNNGNGTFATQKAYAVGSNPSAVVVGPFNPVTTIVSLAVANEGSNNVSVLLGNGIGTFAKAVNYSVGSEPVAIGLANFNGDGTGGSTYRQSIVTANKGDGTLTTLLGAKGSTFKVPAEVTNVGSTPLALAVGAFGVIGSHDPGTVEKGGFGYQASYNWTVGNTLTAPCTGPAYPTAGVWTCNYTGPNGYLAQAVWDSSQSCKNNVCTYSNYTVPSGYTQYATVYCGVFPVENGMVQIGQLPVLLENQNSPNPNYCPNPN